MKTLITTLTIGLLVFAPVTGTVAAHSDHYAGLTDHHEWDKEECPTYTNYLTECYAQDYLLNDWAGCGETDDDVGFACTI